MRWVLKIDDSALKQLSKFPAKDARRILTVTESLIDDPFFGDVAKIRAEKNVWRKRVGSYRIFYELIVDKKLIYVFTIKRRTSQTY